MSIYSVVEIITNIQITQTYNTYKFQSLDSKESFVGDSLILRAKH